MRYDQFLDRSRTRPSLIGQVIPALAALAALAAGCSWPSTASPVDAPRARQALTVALDGWKKGDAPSVFKDALPAMTVQDLDWMGGSKLLDYRLEGDGKETGPNLHIPARLTLQTPQGKEIKKSVTYIVGTSPIVTVFRAFN
jgi:hypothetical protein